MTQQELARSYVKKVRTKLEEFSRIEREAKPEDRKALYTKHDRELDRILTNYDKRLEVDTDVPDEALKDNLQV